MEHVVFYPSADGSPAFRRVGSLDEAVNFVEHLRNIEGVTDFSVHALTSVPLSFRAYYRVEVPADESPVAPAEAPVEGTAAAEPEPAEPAPMSPPPFVDAPAAIVPAPAAAPAVETPAEAPAAEPPAAEEAEPHPVVDPSVEEVVPVPSGRRSMGFFARS
jgi:hypothetical protein